jgi:hypothetical protein
VKIRQLLREESGFEPALIPQLISLLAWNEVAADVITSLRAAVPRIAGQLVDALLDPDQPFAVQRRIPRVLSACPTERIASGLLEGLKHKRFEVRFQCGLALYAIGVSNPMIQIAPAAVFEAVLRESSAGKKVWDSHQLLDGTEGDEVVPFVDEVLRHRTSRTMEHVFRLLSLVLPKQPLQIAFRGLYAGDESLRGIALEYLESVLPASVRGPLWPYLEDRRLPHREVRSQEEILATLMRSHESIELHLAALRAKNDQA